MNLYSVVRRAARLAAMLIACTVSMGIAEDKIVSGTIYGDEANDYGDLVSVVLTVNEGEEADFYSIVMDKTGDELLQQIGNDVTLTGNVELRQDGNKWLTVTKWEPKR